MPGCLCKGCQKKGCNAFNLFFKKFECGNTLQGSPLPNLCSACATTIAAPAAPLRSLQTPAAVPKPTNLTHINIASFYYKILLNYKRLDMSERSAFKKLAQILVDEPFEIVSDWLDGTCEDWRVDISRRYNMSKKILASMGIRTPTNTSKFIVQFSPYECDVLSRIENSACALNYNEIGFNSIQELIQNQMLFTNLLNDPFILDSLPPQNINLDHFTIKYGYYRSTVPTSVSKYASGSIAYTQSGRSYEFIHDDLSKRLILAKIGSYKIMNPHTQNYFGFNRDINEIQNQGKSGGTFKSMERTIINGRWVFYRYNKTGHTDLTSAMASNQVDFWNRLYQGTGYDCAFTFSDPACANLNFVFLPETPDDNLPLARQYLGKLRQFYSLYEDIYFGASLWIEQKFKLTHDDFLFWKPGNILSVANAHNIRIHLDHEKKEIRFHPIDIDSFKLSTKKIHSRGEYINT